MHRPAIWQRIRDNIYTARERKEPDEDDIMICQCSCFARDQNSGCGATCLNRVLNIECEPVRHLFYFLAHELCSPCTPMADASHHSNSDMICMSAGPSKVSTAYSMSCHMLISVCWLTRQGSLPFLIRDLSLQGFCPAGDACTNQMFRKREYARIEQVTIFLQMARAGQGRAGQLGLPLGACIWRHTWHTAMKARSKGHKTEFDAPDAAFLLNAAIVGF